MKGSGGEWGRVKRNGGELRGVEGSGGEWSGGLEEVVGSCMID